MDHFISAPLRGSDNLRLYLQEATLPKMIPGRGAPAVPRSGSKSHRNALSSTQNDFRCLRTILLLKHDRWVKQVQDYHQTHTPDTPMGVDDTDLLTGERLNCAAHPSFNVQESSNSRPTETAKVLQWVDEHALQTSQRVVHLVHPAETQQYAWLMDSPTRDPDSEIFRSCVWGSSTTNTLVFAVQAPWVLSQHDLRLFTKTKSVSQGTVPAAWSDAVEPRPFSSRERLWAKLWDTCYRHRCKWFVVSNYDGFSFGVFSEGWSTAFVTRTIPFNSTSPTVMQCIVFWLTSSMRMPGGHTPSYVFEAPLCEIYIPPLFTAEEEQEIFDDSESEWDADSCWFDTQPSVRPPYTDSNPVTPADYHSVDASLSFQHTTIRGSEATVRDGFHRNARTASSTWTPPEPIPGAYPTGSTPRVSIRRRPSVPETRQNVTAKRHLQIKRSNQTRVQVRRWVQELFDSPTPDVPALFQPPQPFHSHEASECPLLDDTSDTSVYLGEQIYAIARSEASFEFEDRD